MKPGILIAGGGIGGLAAGLAAARAGWGVQVFEQGQMASAVGAGIQLGPNVTRILRDWGLLDAVARQATAPLRLVARDARQGRELAALPLGVAFERRYGAPYLTVHRAHLQAVLLEGALGAGARLHAHHRIASLAQSGDVVHLTTDLGDTVQGQAMLGADGLWSTVRQHLLQDGPPRVSGHVAYRGLVATADLPAPWRAAEVTAWLGPRLHGVTYPVGAGQWLNVVVVVQEPLEGDRHGWDLPGTAQRLQAATGPVGGPLQDLLQAVPQWGLWSLQDRPPLTAAHEMVRGRIALLGDAAHPMRPYLAQGAAMAIEDAHEIGHSLLAAGAGQMSLPEALSHYAQRRWQRVARVQRRSVRNAGVFHATGLLRLARDAALRSLGARLMDVPWLYRG